MATSRDASSAAGLLGETALGWNEEEEEDAPNADAEDWANDTAAEDEAIGADGGITTAILSRDSCGGDNIPWPKADVMAGGEASDRSTAALSAAAEAGLGRVRAFHPQNVRCSMRSRRMTTIVYTLSSWACLS